MTELQKEYCDEKGLIYIKPENTEISDYVNWLETQIQALRIHDVVGNYLATIRKSVSKVIAYNVSRLCAGGALKHESFNPPLNLI